MDGAYVASTPATYENEETDEEPHTAMARNADNDSDYEDGDGWLDEFDDTNAVTLDSANVADVTSPFDNDENADESSLEDDGNSSSGSSSDCAQVVDYNNCESESESEDNETRATPSI